MKRRVVKDATTAETEMGASNTVITSESSTRTAMSSSKKRISSSSTSTKIIFTILLLTIGALVGFILHQKQQFDVQTAVLVEEASKNKEKPVKVEMEKVQNSEFKSIELKYEEKLKTLSDEKSKISDALTKLKDDTSLDQERIKKLKKLKKFRKSAKELKLL